MSVDAERAGSATGHDKLPPPPARPGGFPEKIALFLDLDGTVLDLAATPDAVSIPTSTVDAIGELARRLDGALAIVTGRSLADADHILAPLRLPAAALHGAESRRLGGGRIDSDAGAPPDRLTAALVAFVDARPGLKLENKGASIAVHYRATPDREGEVRAHVGDLVEQFAPAHELQPGKMVVEIRPRGADKGVALQKLMGEAPFVGRTPIVLGDDLTDEFAFEAAIDLGGEAILVGAVERKTAATYELPDPASVRAWLEALARA